MIHVRHILQDILALEYLSIIFGEVSVYDVAKGHDVEPALSLGLVF